MVTPWPPPLGIGEGCIATARTHEEGSSFEEPSSRNAVIQLEVEDQASGEANVSLQVIGVVGQLGEDVTRLTLAEASELDIETALNYLRFQFWNTHILWQASDLDGKIRLQKALFPRGVIWDSEGFGTPPTHSIFKVIPAANADESLIKREFPRLCRGGSSSLTFAGVHPRNSER